MKYYLISGEASGDLHGSHLVRALREGDPQASIRCWGGDLMQAQGAELVKHYRDLAFMGFVEVVKHLPTILRNIRFCKKDILAFQPDALVLIDYPGFNLRIARWAHAQGIRVFYYISPQLWAWHESRVETLKRCVERLFVILPFEREFYQKHQYEVEYVGHPLPEIIDRFEAPQDFREKNGLSDKPIIALLPGSRRQEITRMLGVMRSVVPHFPEYQFVVAGAPSMDRSFYETLLQGHLPLIENQTYSLLRHAQAALVTSGTATLETALFGVPQVVCYRGSNLSYQIAKRLVRVPFISLVNLIAGREVVRELIQHELEPEQLRQELAAILPGGEKRDQLITGYRSLREKLGPFGAPSRVAQGIISRISNTPSSRYTG